MDKCIHAKCAEYIAIGRPCRAPEDHARAESEAVSAGRGTRRTRRELSLSHEGPHLDQWVEYAELPYVPHHGRDCCWSEHCGPQYGCAPVEMREQVLRTYPATPAESAAARAVGQ